MGEDFLKFKKLEGGGGLRGQSRAREEKDSSHFFTRFSLGQFADCHQAPFMTLHVIGAKCLGFVIAVSMW